MYSRFFKQLLPQCHLILHAEGQWALAANRPDASLRRGNVNCPPPVAEFSVDRNYGDNLRILPPSVER